MNIRKYFLLMSIIALVSWLIFVLVAQMIDPEITNWIGFSLFYLSLFMSLSVSFAIILFAFKVLFFKDVLVFHLLKNSSRQAFLISFLIIAALLMLAENIFSWFNILIVAIILLILEYVFIRDN